MEFLGINYNPLKKPETLSENLRRNALSGKPIEVPNFAQENINRVIEGRSLPSERDLWQVGLSEPRGPLLKERTFAQQKRPAPALQVHPLANKEEPKIVSMPRGGVTPTKEKNIPSNNKKTTATTPAEQPKEKKGLSQAEIKSQIEASVKANPDPKTWGLNGAMPQGWGAVKLSNGKVVVTPPNESNFYGDPEAEKAWRAAEADRKLGLWSKEKIMDPSASLKERGLAYDVWANNGGVSGGATSTNGLRGQLTAKDIENNQLDLNKEQRAAYEKSKEWWNNYIDRNEQPSIDVVDGDKKITRNNPLNAYIKNYLAKDPNFQQMLLATRINDPARGDAKAAELMNHYIEALRGIYADSNGSNELPDRMVYEDRASWEIPWVNWYIPEVFGDNTSYYLNLPGVGKQRINSYDNMSTAAKEVIQSWARKNKESEKLGLSQGQ